MESETSRIDSVSSLLVFIPSLIFGVFFLFVDGSCLADGEARKLGDGRVEDGLKVCHQS